MARTRDSNSPSDIGKTIAQIIADGGSFWHKDKVLTSGGVEDSIKLTDAELVDYLNQLGVGGSSNDATSIMQTLTDSGDSFTVDLTSLTPPATAKKLIHTIYEKGTGGGERFAQNNLYRQTYTGGTDLYSSGVDTPTDWVYFAPLNATKILRVNKFISGLSEQVGGVLAVGSKTDTGVYDPIHNRIYFAGSVSGYQNLLILDLNDLTTRVVAVTGEYSTGIWSEMNQAIYFAPVSAGTTQILKIVPDPVSETISNVGTVFPAVNTRFGDFIAFEDRAYLTPRSSSNVYVFDYATENSTLLTTPALTGSQAYLRGALVGSNIYCAPLTDTVILKIDTLTDTVTKLAQTVPAGAFAYSDAVYLPLLGKLYFVPFQSVGYLDFNLGTETFEVVGNATNQSSGFAFNNKIIAPPAGTSTRAADFILSEPFFSETNPLPYNSVANVFDTTGSINRAANPADYRVDITEDGGGNATQLEITMLTDGQKEVTINIKTGQFN